MFNGLNERKNLALKFLIFFVLVALPSAASFAQSTIDFDSGALITQINTWIPVFLPILAIGLGIAVAIALIERVGSSILKGIRGGGGAN
jgi:hypothetical protein